MANSNLNMLASSLNGMKNPIHIGPSVGKVVELNPFTVSIAGGSVLLTEGEELLVCERLKDHTYSCKIELTAGETSGQISIVGFSAPFTGSATLGITSGTFDGTLTGDATGSATMAGATAQQEGEITIYKEIAVNDLVLVVPMEGEQTWIAVDRIGGDGE